MDFLFLSRSSLFQGIPEEDIQGMLTCLGAVSKDYSKGETVLRVGDRIQAMGLVLEGSVNIENDDAWGNKTILDNIGPGQVFAETYACLPDAPLMVNAVAAEKTEILFLRTARLLETCSSTCPHHGQLIQNLLAVTARKNLNLSRRIFYTSSKTIRGRLLSYLSDQAVRQGDRRFSIPFDRQQLADYLGVDRSALSNELSKMQRDGLIRVEKNHFLLLKGMG